MHVVSSSQVGTVALGDVQRVGWNQVVEAVETVGR